MFNLNEKYEVDQKIQRSDFLRHSPSKISTLNTANTQIYTNIPREDSVISLSNIYLHLNFVVLRNDNNNRQGVGANFRRVNLGPIALLKFYK